MTKRSPVLRGLVNLTKVLRKLPSGHGGWNPVFIYEDQRTRNWALDVHARICRLSDSPADATWWRLGELNQPGVLAGAVSSAIRSELIVVAVRSREGLPLPFYIWVNSWLPHRVPGSSALVALLITPWKPAPYPTPVHRHLQAIAERGKMDLIFDETFETNLDPALAVTRDLQNVLAN